MHMPDITIHINQTLTDEEKGKLETAMREVAGVIAPRFNLPHMLVVLYTTQKTSSAELLAVVRNRGYQAQIVGI